MIEFDTQIIPMARAMSFLFWACSAFKVRKEFYVTGLNNARIKPKFGPNVACAHSGRWLSGHEDVRLKLQNVFSAGLISCRLSIYCLASLNDLNSSTYAFGTNIVR